MKKLFKAENSNYNAVKFEVYYDKGGYNQFSHKKDQRGYWLSITPLTLTTRTDSDGREYTMEQYECMSGRRLFLLEVARKSVGKENEAVNMVFNNFEKYKEIAKEQIGLDFTDEEV